MKKRLVAIIMCVALFVVSVFGLNFPQTNVLAATSGSCSTSGNAKFTYDESSNTLRIHGTGAIKDYGVTVINRVPWYSYRGSCTTLVIEEGITEIGDRAFYQMAVLENVSLPSTLKTIKDYAFSECPKLTHIDLPENLQAIRQHAFDTTGLTSITFPDSLTSLGSTNLGIEAGFSFANCPDLETVTYGAGLTATGAYAFHSSGVKNIVWNENINTVSAWSFYGNSLTTVEIPENVTAINTRAFANNFSLTKAYVYNSECTFNGIVGEDPFNGSQQSLVFYGHSKSTTQTYAEEKGYTFISIDPCAHDNTYDDVIQEATCDIAGKKNIVCSECGAIIKTEEIPALGHDFVTIESQDNTAVDGHYYEYQACSRCQAENTVATHNEWVEGYYTETTTATCTKLGIKTTTCSICGEKKYSLPYREEHNVENYTSITEPTCTTDGSKKGVCTMCNQTVTVTLPATGHTETLVSTNTTDDGHTYNTYKCSVCSNERTECIHNEWAEGLYTEDVVSQVTCITNGSIEKKCTVCGYTETQTVQATGHSYDDGVVTKEPTCTETGQTTYTCSKCSNSYSIPILSLGHDYSVEKILAAPTCTEAGTGAMQCSRCTAANTYEIPALGHDISSSEDYQITVEPTCTTAGTSSGTCSRCNTFVEVELPASGHILDTENAVVTKPATCTEAGKANAVCTVCGETSEITLEPLGHHFVFSEINKGTVGMTITYNCTRCDEYDDVLQSTVKLGFELYMNSYTADVTNGYRYDADNNGIINMRDYTIIIGNY